MLVEDWGQVLEFLARLASYPPATEEQGALVNGERIDPWPYRPTGNLGVARCYQHILSTIAALPGAGGGLRSGFRVPD